MTENTPARETTALPDPDGSYYNRLLLLAAMLTNRTGGRVQYAQPRWSVNCVINKGGKQSLDSRALLLLLECSKLYVAVSLADYNNQQCCCVCHWYSFFSRCLLFIGLHFTYLL